MRSRLFLSAWLGLLFLPACSDESVTLKIAKPAADRPDVADASAAPIHIPDTAPFNLVPFTSGQTGQGSGAASATPQGTALAEGKCRDGGSAFGEFQLGYALDYTAGKPANAVIQIKIDALQTVSSTGDAGDTTARSALTLLVKDSNGLTLHSEPLMVGASPGGPRRLEAVETTHLDLKMEPGMGYFIVVAGRVDARAAAGTADAAARIEVRACRLSIEWPAQAAASR